MTIRLAACIALALPNAAFSADSLHRKCNQMIENAYAGHAIIRNDPTKTNAFLFELVRKKRITIEQKDKIDAELEATSSAVSDLVKTLSVACADAANSLE